MRLALLYSLPGDLAVDPFSGSGTTQVACIETGRAFVGADLFYDDLRARRLANTTPDASSPLPGVSDESVAVWQAEARRACRCRGAPGGGAVPVPRVRRCRRVLG